MNPPTTPSSTPGRWHRLAWLPIPVLLVAIVALKVADLPAAYESPFLLMLFNFVFSTLASMLVVVLVGRSFLLRSTPGLLLFGCGVLAWGAAGTVGPALLAHGNNVTISVHNLLVWFSALCHLAGAALSLNPGRVVRRPVLLLAAGYTVVVGVVWVVTMLVLEGWTPVFFVQGRGGTPLRYFVLGSAALMFAGAPVLLWVAYRRAPPAFVRWYGLALLLVATGLFGIMIESVHASLLSWTGRAAQFLGGGYMLVAALAAVREAGAWTVDLSATLAEAQAAAQRSENRYRLLAAATFEGIAVTEQGRFVDANDQLLRMLGCERAELIGRPVADWLPAEDRARVLANIRAGRESLLEHQMVRPDGTRLTVEAHGKTVAEGARTVRYTALRDITERKRAEEALRQSNEELTRFNRAAVDRELRMIELKKEINALCAGAGQPPRYRVESQKEQP